MLIVLKPSTPEAVAADVATRLRMAGLAVHRTEYDGRVRIAAVGEPGAVDWKQVEGWSGVESVSKLARPFKLASRAFHPHDTIITVGKVAIGGPQLAIMAGPCSVEGEEQVFTIAREVAAAGATVLRGGAYKPRTSRTPRTRLPPSPGSTPSSSCSKTRALQQQHRRQDATRREGHRS